LAFNEFKKSTESAVKLLIVGEAMFMTRNIQKTLDSIEFKEDVFFPGRMEPENLSKVTAAALALVFVPYFEGFGIPVLEALYSETPVICSNITSMPEIAGDAALFVNPFEVDSITAAMLNLWKNPDVRIKLIEKGRAQRLKFSWDKTADKLWNSMGSVLQLGN
jgi:glycosyltransferase involved in cell wall biosynthesis